MSVWWWGRWVMWDRTEKGKEERSSLQVCDLLSKPEGGNASSFHTPAILPQVKGWATIPKMTFPCASGKNCILTGIYKGKKSHQFTLKSHHLTKNNEQRTEYFMTGGTNKWIGALTENMG